MRGYFGVLPENPQPPKKGEVITITGIAHQRDGRYLVTAVNDLGGGKFDYAVMWVGPIEAE